MTFARSVAIPTLHQLTFTSHTLLIPSHSDLLPRRKRLRRVLMSELRLADHRVHGMRGLERLELDVQLLLDRRRRRRGRDEPEEGRRGVQRARAELGVGLQADEVWVVCVCFITRVS